MDKFIVSIFGGSGSGKSTLAIRLVEIFGDDCAVRIPSDYFLCSYDSPPQTLDYDWDLLEEVLGQEAGTTISVPTYDFQAFRRVFLEGEKRLVMRPLVIIDSMVPYSKANYTVLLTDWNPPQAMPFQRQWTRRISRAAIALKALNNRSIYAMLWTWETTISGTNIGYT